MSRPLKMSDDDRIGCSVTYSVNQFLVHHKDGYLLTSARDKDELETQLEINKIENAAFDLIASRMYFANLFNRSRH